MTNLSGTGCSCYVFFGQSNSTTDWKLTRRYLYNWKKLILKLLINFQLRSTIRPHFLLFFTFMASWEPGKVCKDSFFTFLISPEPGKPFASNSYISMGHDHVCTSVWKILVFLWYELSVLSSDLEISSFQIFQTNSVLKDLYIDTKIFIRRMLNRSGSLQRFICCNPWWFVLSSVLPRFFVKFDSCRSNISNCLG